MTNETEAPAYERKSSLTTYDLLDAFRRNPLLTNVGADICTEAILAIDAKDKRIAELEAERDEQSDQIEELQQACEVVSSEFEGEIWQSCRRILQNTEAEYQARIADLEANLATAVAELEREADNHEEDADYHDDNCNDPDKSFHRGQAQRLRTIIAALKGPNQ